MKLGQFKPKSGNSDRVKITDLLDIKKFPDGKWLELRILPLDGASIKTHWINIIAGKDKREVKIPKICLGHNPTTDEETGIECPYCALEGQQSGVKYYVNAIIRSVQEDKPARVGKATAAEKKSGFKDKDSDSWTPVQVLEVSSSLMKKIMELTDLNKVKVKGKDGKPVTKTFGVDDAKYGCDISIKYDSKKQGTDMYSVQKGDRSPLSEEELAYLVYEINGEDLVKQMGLETLKTATAEIKKMEIVGDDEMSDDDDEDDLGSSKKKAKGKPAVKGKPSAKSKRQVDEEDDEDEEDEDEDDEPKSKSKKPAAKSKRQVDDEDDEEDEDFDDDSDDDEDEDDEPKPKSKKPASKGKRKPADEDDEDEDEDDEEDDDFDDDEDSDDDDSDDEDDDFDDDEEEEEEKPTRKSSTKKAPAKKAPAKKPASKSRRKSDDDSDDDIPF